MFARIRPLSLLLASILVPGHAPASDMEKPPVVLQVIRLKAGESKSLELALPEGEFRPSGSSQRDFILVMPASKGKKSAKDRPLPPEDALSSGSPELELAKDLAIIWEKDKPAITVRAATQARQMTEDVRLVYSSFVQGESYHLGLRIVVEPK